MAHVESYSLHPVDDKELIDWIRQQSNKSDTVKKALYLYKETSDILDIASLAEKLMDLPLVLEAVKRIEYKLENTQSITLANEANLPLQKDINAMDMMEQMDNF